MDAISFIDSSSGPTGGQGGTGGTGGTRPPTFHLDQFFIASKFDEKMSGEGLYFGNAIFVM